MKLGPVSRFSQPFVAYCVWLAYCCLSTVYAKASGGKYAALAYPW